MKKGVVVFLFIVLVFIIAGCQKDQLVDKHTIYAQSNEIVELEANNGYKNYQWIQKSGKSVLLSNADSRITTFVAPIVNTQEKLTFQITAVKFNGFSVRDTVEVTVDPVKNIQTPFKDIRKLVLKVSKKRLNLDTNTTFALKAFYKDGGEKYIYPKFIKWKVVPKGAVEIKDNLLIAKQDGNASITAIVCNTVSNTVKLNIYWKVDGHLLPPEPDPKVNNATLLGVDVNHNGVRDDVERWIYKTYKDKHPIYIDIAMQAARGYKLILEKQPKTKEEAKKVMKKVDKSIYCELYYTFDAKYFGDPILIKEGDHIDNGYFRKKIYFNTKARYKIFDRYDQLLSGDSYKMPPEQEEKAACEFNTSKYNRK